MPIVEIGQCGISYPRAGLISLCSSDSGIMRLFMSNWTQDLFNTFLIYATYAYLCWNCICKALFVLRSRSMPLYSWVGLPVSSHLIFGLRLLLVFLNSINQWSCFCRFWPGSIMYVLNNELSAMVVLWFLATMVVLSIVLASMFISQFYKYIFSSFCVGKLSVNHLENSTIWLMLISMSMLGGEKLHSEVTEWQWVGYLPGADDWHG